MGDEQRPDTAQGYNDESPLPSLESAESYVSRGKTADNASDGSREAFKASFSTLLDWAKATNLIRSEEHFSFFRRPPEGFGDEHQAWFDESCNRWFKATYPNEFGLAWGRRGTATAGEYLTRLVLQNQYFGDDLQLVAIIDSKQKMRILTSQPHIPGNAATVAEITLWFRGLNFCRLECGGSVAWYRKSDNLLVADAHEGNVIKTIDGPLFAIDLNIIKPKGEMLDSVLSLIGQTF